MSKFEVGDIVKALPEADHVYSITNTSMGKAVIVNINDGRMDDITLKYGDATYPVNSKYFEKIGHLKPFIRAEVIARLAAGEKDALAEYDLSGADLSDADLRRANLNGANLSGADLSDADLNGANLSQSKGLLDAINFMEAHFERTSEGYIVYKSFGAYRSAPASWEIKPGSVISENVNPNRADTCGSGINVAPIDWVRRDNRRQPYKLLIRFEWLVDVVVPYNTDGKIRCGRAEIIGPVED